MKKSDMIQEMDNMFRRGMDLGYSIEETMALILNQQEYHGMLPPSSESKTFNVLGSNIQIHVNEWESEDEKK
jgi:hypothetical protein